MSRPRARTWAALAAAVLVLLGTVGAAIAVGATNGLPDTTHPRGLTASTTDQFSVGPGMMTRRATLGGHNAMMAARDGDTAGSMMRDRLSAMGPMMASNSALGMRGRFACTWPMMRPGSSQVAAMMGAAWADATLHRLTGTGSVTAGGARVAAQDWLTRWAPSATLSGSVRMPMGYHFLGVVSEKVVAMIMVDPRTGTVTGRVLATPTTP